MQAAVDLKEIKGKHGKRYAEAFSRLRKAVPKAETALPYSQALSVILDAPNTKFDQTVDVAIRLGVDPKQADQMVRGAVTLPHGLGKTATVVVFAKGEKATEAKKAGADHVGAEDLVEKILGGWQEFSAVVATPDMMGVVSKLGRVLGPKGLMPNPKIGTVTFDLTTTVQDLKKGRAEFRIEKAGIIHSAIGKMSFGVEKLAENFKALLDQIVRSKPSGAKGQYVQSLYVSSSMGPSVKVDHQEFLEK
jgi:large subunit ribosomal protein L1